MMVRLDGARTRVLAADETKMEVVSGVEVEDGMVEDDGPSSMTGWVVSCLHRPLSKSSASVFPISMEAYT